MKEPPLNRSLLEAVSEKGELEIQDLLARVPRKNGTYLDFFPVALLLHAKYLQTDTTTQFNDVRETGKLGFDTLQTAQALCQIALSKGETFIVNDVPRDSWSDAKIKIFITADGALKLEELQERENASAQKKTDYRVSTLVAVLAALLSAAATHYLSTR